MLGGIVLSKRDIEYLEVEIAPIMRAVSVEDPANMQWAIDVITLSNARRSGAGAQHPQVRY